MLPEQAFAGHRIPETDVARGLASEVNGTTPRVECAIAARVVKSVDTADLKSAAARRAGSSPAPGTPRRYSRTARSPRSRSADATAAANAERSNGFTRNASNPASSALARSSGMP